MADNQYIEEIRQVWDLVKESFRNSLSDTTVNLWFGEIDILSFSQDLITMGIPSEFKYGIVREKYLDKIQSEFSRLLGFDIRVELVFTGSPTATDSMPTVLQPAASAVPDRDGERQQVPSADEKDGSAPVMPIYNFEYTFENFIVGSTNKFAHAACVAVANHPATNYNPLFIYGNSGLGKTHLMCAIINRMKQNNPDVKIIYTKGEDFTNQMIACLANKSMDEFRDKFRKCDVLLIDDIQFIAGKISIQEEFFHTFNALFEEKKQIILTSDRPPRDIKLLEDRLRTRFEWGLIADIQPPDYELRIAIMQNKAKMLGITLPKDVTAYMAENFKSDIRQIEGAVKKISARCFLSKEPITLELAKECTAPFIKAEASPSVTADSIIAHIAKKYGVAIDDILGRKRTKDIAKARNIAIYSIRRVTGLSQPMIGKKFDRDHTTILSAINSIDEEMKKAPLFELEINDLIKELTE